MAESPKYTVIEKEKNIELREYGSYIQAEVDVTGSDYQSAIRSGFRVLADFIFGNNVARQNIEMTTPVKVEQSQKIAMTTPVKVTGEGTYTVAFIMPSEFTLESLPIPNDNRVRIHSVPAHQIAVIRFSGYFKEDVIARNKQNLKDWIAAQGLETASDFTVAGYNPPWVPGILARNEVMVEVNPSI